MIYFLQFLLAILILMRKLTICVCLRASRTKARGTSRRDVAKQRYWSRGEQRIIWGYRQPRPWRAGPMQGQMIARESRGIEDVAIRDCSTLLRDWEQRKTSLRHWKTFLVVGEWSTRGKKRDRVYVTPCLSLAWEELLYHWHRIYPMWHLDNHTVYTCFP